MSPCAHGSRWGSVCGMWSGARGVLIRLLAGVDGVGVVLDGFPSDAVPLSSGVGVVLPPAARSGVRQPGATRWTVTQPVHVLRMLSSDPAAATADIEVVVDGIGAVLETSIALGGAVSASEAPVWDEGDLMEWPPGSGIWFARSLGRVQFLSVFDVERGA